MCILATFGNILISLNYFLHLIIAGQYAFAPVAAGFLAGALFVYGADVLMTYAGVSSPFDLG